MHRRVKLCHPGDSLTYNYGRTVPPEGSMQRTPRTGRVVAEVSGIVDGNPLLITFPRFLYIPFEISNN